MSQDLDCNIIESIKDFCIYKEMTKAEALTWFRYRLKYSNVQFTAADELRFLSLLREFRER